MLETSTSPGPAWPATRAPMWTAMPGELVAGDLALAGVQAGADLEPEPRDGVRSSACAQRIARAGPSKVARKPSPAVSTSRPRKRASCAPDRRVVRLEQLAPAPVAELARALGRADDVGEEHRREHAVRLGRLAHAGQELWTSSRISSPPPPAQGMWTLPGSST